MKAPERQRQHSIRTILLMTFLLLSVVTLVLSSVIFGVIQYRSMKSNAIRGLQESCASLSESLRLEIREMDTILLYCIASSEMKEEFLDYYNSPTPFERNKNRQRLAGILFSLKGFDFAIRQLSVYDIEEGGFGVGNYHGDLPVSAGEEIWYEEAVKNTGRKCITAPVREAYMSKSAGMDEETGYISVSRMFYNDLHVPMGFVEVREYYSEFFRRALAQKTGLHPRVAVYDTEGRQIYPEDEQYAYFEEWKSGDRELLDEKTGKRQYLCFAENEEDGLLVAMAADNSEFMAPVYRSLSGVLLSVLIVFIICLLLAAALSRRMSDPIRNIYAFLSDPDKGQFEQLELADTGIREIDKLKLSLNENIQARENTTKTMLTLKEQEMQARMLALQSQMNPHFLYNSLSAIAEMADIGMTDQVSAMCGDITSILRYISSDEEPRIRVEEEMEQVDRYLHCMKRRYAEDLSVEYRIGDDVLDCMVPKLTVQLLVENAVKSMTTRKGPWKVTVTGYRKDSDWYVTVEDNGPGFDPEVDLRLRKNMDEILETGMLPSLKIEGMGILNIFIRLYLLDGIPFIFDFGNREEGGAFVTVGGHVHDSD